ncbi:MAG: type II toxin-antitoxin system HicB family antitoxin [Methanosarcinales archaeon]
MNYKFSAIIEKEENWYVASCPELEVASQGKSIEDALNNLKEAVELYIETVGRDNIHLSETFPIFTTLEVTV